MMACFTQAADVNSELNRRGIVPTYPNDFAADVAADTLPSVSWVVPNLLECEHPALPAALGAVGIVQVLDILTSNPKVWEKTALIISYDENGGFFDHVTPPTAPEGTPGEYRDGPESELGGVVQGRARTDRPGLPGAGIRHLPVQPRRSRLPPRPSTTPPSCD